MTKVNSRVVDLENGNITGALMALALPIMGSMLIQMAYTLVDTAGWACWEATQSQQLQQQVRSFGLVRV